MNRFMAAALAALCLAQGALAAERPGGPKQPEAPTPEQQQLIAKYEALAEALHPQFGDVTIPTAQARLHLGRAYYFLSPEEAKRVLIEAWGNPPDATANVLGMVFPAGKGFYSDTWGAVVTFDGAGFVTDKQATPAEYDELIKKVQSGEANLNAKRREAGFPAMHLVGWAQPPSYDKASHTVIWARDIQVGGRPDDSLNYDLRVLGRRGVLSLNLVDKMPNLASVRPAAEQLRRTAAFEPGATFEDFKPGVDKAAGYGIAGLVGAGLGIAVAQKLGLLALGLVFLKKGFVVVLAALAGTWRWMKGGFGRNRKSAPAPTALASATEAESVPPASPE